MALRKRATKTQAPTNPEITAPPTPEFNPKSNEPPRPKSEPKGPAMIEVRPVQGSMFEPFQKLWIREGAAPTPVRETSWVLEQLKAGLLRRC